MSVSTDVVSAGFSRNITPEEKLVLLGYKWIHPQMDGQAETTEFSVGLGLAEIFGETQISVG